MDKEVGTITGKVTKDIREEVMEDMEVRRATTGVKEATKDGTRQEVTKGAKEEVKRARGLSPTANARALNVGARAT